MKSKPRVRGFFEVEHIRDGKVLRKFRFENDVTYEGMNHMLDSTFHAATQEVAWFIGLINNSGSPTLLISDTAASHSGWIESTDYDETERPDWTMGAAASGAIDSSSVATFTIDTTVTIYGIFIDADDAGTSGILWASGAFDSPISAVDDDTIKVNYSVELSE